MSGNLVPFPSIRPVYVLDTWPVMEWLKDRQPQAARFDELISLAHQTDIILKMSMMNVGEVYYSSIKEWGLAGADEILSRLRELPILLVLITTDAILMAARLKAPSGISYADGFAAGLAIREDCPLITGDPDFLALEYGGVLRLKWLGA